VVAARTTAARLRRDTADSFCWSAQPTLGPRQDVVHVV
jgi:hypothetical protein